MELTQEQRAGLEILNSRKNVFLTGRAGTGKSFLIHHYLQDLNPDTHPVLASTGAAALLVGGRTFHSFWGLGILEGGLEKTVDRALRNPRVVKRIRKAQAVLVDEISMLSGPTLACAERIACLARGSDEPWGGLRFIAIGDFAQLPPINRFAAAPEWAFLDDVWLKSDFSPVVLQKIMRSSDPHWVHVLNLVRDGICNSEVEDFLNSRQIEAEDNLDATRLFPHRNTAEEFNLHRLRELEGEETLIATTYAGAEPALASLKKTSPIPEVLILKIGALVMLRKNDIDGQFVNGSLGHVTGIQKKYIRIELLDTGREIELETMSFELLDGDGNVTASAKNFPLTLAYGSTIHKAQGATIDRLIVDLGSLWESGQAYVALSRVKSPENLYLSTWSKRSIKADARVKAFHASLDQ